LSGLWRLLWGALGLGALQPDDGGDILNESTTIGKIAWQYDVLLIGSCAGTFYAFDKRTGKVRWSYNIHQDADQTSFHGNPLITDQLVLIGTDKSCASGGIGHVYAFDRSTGTVRWKYRTAGTPDRHRMHWFHHLFREHC
jgi:outer membrane protein assembly factor BamB